MKHLILIIVIAIVNSPDIEAQTTYCGLTYYYDNAGNRIQRKITDCGDPGPGGGGGNSGKRDLTETDTTAVTSNLYKDLQESLFPNPTAGNVSILFSDAVNSAQISIMDNIGRKLFGTVSSGTSASLDLSAYADGVYIITVTVNGRRFQHSVVKH